MPGQQPTVKMVPVDAKLLESVGYVIATRRLYVKIRGSSVLYFEGVPGFRHTGLMSAPRKDAYYTTFIRNSFLAKEVPTPAA
jgi:hypothetical protein